MNSIVNALRNHRQAVKRQQDHAASLVRTGDEDYENPFCIADIDSPCNCKDCKRYEAESMASALASYVPKKTGGQQVSDCCGAADRDTGDCDSSYADFGLCSQCKDHCEYVDEEEEV